MAAELKTELVKSHAELVKSLEYTQGQADDRQTSLDKLTAEVADIRKNLHQQTTNRQQHQQVQPTPSQSITVSGLVKEGTEGQELVAQVSNFITSHINPACEVNVVGVDRLGRLDEGKEGHRRVKVTLGSAAEAAAVLRAARNLKSFNSERKQQGDRPVGVDQFLSREEQEKKQQLWGKWVEARKQQTPKTFWKGCRLFVEGTEVLP